MISFVDRARTGLLGLSQIVFSRIRWKIVAPYLVLSLLVAGSGTFLATRLITASLADRFNNQLIEAGRVASDALVRRERQHLAVARAIAFTDGVPAAVESGEGATIKNLVAPIAVNGKAELVEVLDASGQRLYGLRLDSE